MIARSPRRRPGWLACKSLEAIRHDVRTSRFKRALGPTQLVLFGIGCIIGAGIYVLTGLAAANYAGPAVVLSFVIAGAACALTGLCYAELSSVLPLSGATYSYAYVALGEIYAWLTGWMLMLTFGLSAAALAVSFSGYLTAMLADFSIYLPAVISTSFVEGIVTPEGLAFSTTGSINLVATATLVLIYSVLIRGVGQSSAVNTLLVSIKLTVLIGFIVVGAFFVNGDNWTPFVPENEGGFQYGVPGIFRGASLLFFAFLGFEAVAVASAEARKPERDVPIGIIGSLVVSVIIYCGVAIVMTGIVSYTELGVHDPFAVAVAAMNRPVFAFLVKVGAMTGIASVLLVNAYSHPRIAAAISIDGLLPRLFGSLHARFRTPAAGTLCIGAVVCIAAATLPVNLLADLVSIGVAVVCVITSLSVIAMRNKYPDLPRPFRVPLGGVRIKGYWIGTVPVLALLSSLLMMGPVLIDIGRKTLHGEWLPPAILLLHMGIGLLIYRVYGSKRSRTRAEASRDGVNVKAVGQLENVS